jgi:hypothetical protein
LDGGDDHPADDIVPGMDPVPEPLRSGWPRWATLAVLGAVTVPVNILLSVLFLRLSVIEFRGDLGGEVLDAGRDIANFAVEWPMAVVRGDGEAWMIILPALGLLAAQAVFLLPWTGGPPRIGSGPGRSLWWSTAVAAFVGAAISVGLVYGLVEGLYQLMSAGVPREISGEQALAAFQRAVPGGTWLLALPLLGLVPVWILWGVLLSRLTAAADPLRGERQLRRLFATSLASIVLVIPFDVLARRRGACMCATGTWLSLCIGFAALLWLAGPAVVLFLSRQRRRAWRREICLACGYARRGQTGVRCSECGTEFGPTN